MSLTIEQISANKPKASDLKPGYLLFLDTDDTDDKTADHVMMYVGDGEVVHAEGRIYGKVVKENLSEVLERYENIFVGYGRVKEIT